MPSFQLTLSFLPFSLSALLQILIVHGAQLDSGIPCIEISQLPSSQGPKAAELASDPFLSARGTPFAWMMNGKTSILHPPPRVFAGLMPQKTSTNEQQLRAEKGPFSPQQMFFSN